MDLDLIATLIANRTHALDFATIPHSQRDDMLAKKPVEMFTWSNKTQ
jgi:hypothetical protein